MKNTKENLINLIGNIKGVPADRQKKICALLASNDVIIPENPKGEKQVYHFLVLVLMTFPHALDKENQKNTVNLLNNFTAKIKSR